jgi:hypothetical protein
MTSDNLFNLNEVLGIEQFYQTEGIFYEPFFEFESKLSSLQRFYAMSLSASKRFIVESQASAAITKAKEQTSEIIDIHFDITSSDIQYFEKFLFSSVLAQTFSLFESFLLGVIDTAGVELNIEPQIPKDNIPLANRYIKWLTSTAGCEINISKDTWATFDVLRQIRNQFVHAHISEVPAQMKEKFLEIKSKTQASGLTEAEGYTYVGFKTIASAAKEVELGFLKRFSG